MDKKLFFKFLFNDEPDPHLDPNRIENVARINAEAAKHASRMRQAKATPIFEAIENLIKSGVYQLLQAPATTNCGCPTCQRVRAVATLMELWTYLEKQAEKGES